MPTYQYACTACGDQLEAVQSFTDEPLTECPACEGRLRKVFNSVGVVFKGSGFYRTDSRAGADPAKGGSDKDGADKGSSDKGGADKGGADKGGADKPAKSDSSSGGGAGSSSSKSGGSTGTSNGSSGSSTASASSSSGGSGKASAPASRS